MLSISSSHFVLETCATCVTSKSRMLFRFVHPSRLCVNTFIVQRTSLSTLSRFGSLGKKIRDALGMGGPKTPKEQVEALLPVLHGADLGSKVVNDITTRLKQRVEKPGLEEEGKNVQIMLREELLRIMRSFSVRKSNNNNNNISSKQTDQKSKNAAEESVGISAADYLAQTFSGADRPRPMVIFLVGSNGVGKTTTAVKLAHYLSVEQKLRVMLCAGDTFRAAAVAQLQVWSQRLGFDLYSVPQSISGKAVDPAGVVRKALLEGKAKDVDVILCDTAGRLHNNRELMKQLTRIKQAAMQIVPNAPHHVWIVVDATIGTNSVHQAETFRDTVGANGVILTKMDSSARGGAAVSLQRDVGLPVLFVGTGEGERDLSVFDAVEYVDRLVGLKE